VRDKDEIENGKLKIEKGRLARCEPLFFFFNFQFSIFNSFLEDAANA